MELVLANPAGVGPHIFPSTSTPRLASECTAPDMQEKIGVFEARKLSPKDREKAIAHYKRCLPCRMKLGWGTL